MRVGVCGSGFGLYGYLPALIAVLGVPVILPFRYRPFLENRDDIRHLDASVSWVEDEGAMMDTVDALVISQRPADQTDRVIQLSRYPHVTRVLLEKPVAQSPIQADFVLRRLLKERRTFRIGYTFRNAPWAQKLASLVVAVRSTIKIHWLFQAHHYAFDTANWKRTVSTGGGALHFYGIHLIALLAELGYRNVASSQTNARYQDEAETWTATFTEAGQPNIEVFVNSNAVETLFAIRNAQNGVLDIEMREPFEEMQQIRAFDRRVSSLAALCRDLLESEMAAYTWYAPSIDLWRRVEECNEVRQTIRHEPTNEGRLSAAVDLT